MLSALKEKLSSVQDGIVSSLNRDDTSNQTNKKEYLAGAYLLKNYQQNWIGINDLSEQNCLQAAAIDQQIEDFYTSVKIGWETFRMLTNEIENLNDIIILTEKAVNSIGNMRTLTEEVHVMIVELEYLIELDEVATARLCLNDSIANYRKETLASFDLLREKLSEEHELKMKFIDEENEKIKKENFKMAAERFREDVTTYKQSGILPRSVKHTGEYQSVDDVEIEQDTNSLEKYLDE